MIKKIKKIYKKIPNWIKNKYLISGFLFFIWISFFDINSIITQLEKRKEIQKIEHDIQYYSDEIKKDKEIIEILSQDSLTPMLEKHLREKLFFSKKNEEVFIIE